MKNASTRYIGFPIYDGVSAGDFIGPAELFRFCGKDFQPIFLAPTIRSYLSAENLVIVPNFTFDHHPDLYMVFVPGGSGIGTKTTMLDPRYLDWIKKVDQHTQWTGSVCTGAFILAATGLLDGMAATTYWSQLENLSLFPDLSVDQNNFPRALIDVQRQRFTGGGISSATDLALELLIEIEGKDTAELGQLQVQYAPNPPVHAGDPSQASPELVNKLEKAHEPVATRFIREGVEETLASQSG